MRAIEVSRARIVLPQPAGVGIRSRDEGCLEVMHLLVSLTEGAKFENSPVLETIGPDLVSSVRPQILTEELEAGEETIKPDRTR